MTNITATSASSGGEITADGGAAITTRGVCWSTNHSPTTSDGKTSNGSGTGSFTSSIIGLTPGATYNIKVYATNSVGTGYSSQSTFTTLSLAPVLTTTDLTAITSISASSGGNITSDGGAAITARGVCWSTTTNPTIVSSKTTDGTGSGTFSSSITGLIPGTTYYVRAYATNSIGTAYGNEVTAVATAILPVLTTTAISALTSTSATSGGNITSDGGAAITARGVCWSTSQNPTIANSKTTDGTGSGSFTSSITGLTPGATYYVRAYATNSIGAAYGNEVTATASAILPVLTTTAISTLTSTTATCGGNITSDGGAAVTARGVCWSTTANPTIASSKTTDGTGSCTFSSSFTGLIAGTTYYVRAWATNIVNTAYGNQVSFTTTSSGGTSSVTDIDGNVYNTVTIGTQVWMVENLKTTKYRNGDPIPNVTGDVAWAALTTGAYCNINNDAAMGAKYGKLYNWYAVHDSRNIAPTGWHVPTYAEWTTLETYVTANGGTTVAKALASKTDWVFDTSNGAAGYDLTTNNTTGFSALPGGCREMSGYYDSIGYNGNWWSSTEFSTGSAWYRYLYGNNYYLDSNSYNKKYGFSVRCLRD